MSWIFGSNEPSKEDMMLAMLDAQGKVIAGLVAEVENLNLLLQSHFNTCDLDVEGKPLHFADKSVQVQVPVSVPLHQKEVKDIDDIFQIDFLNGFIDGCVITEESENYTEDTEDTEDTVSND